MNTTLTEVCHDLVHSKDQTTPMAVIAERLGKNLSTLYGELDPSRANFKLGADEILPLMNAVDSNEPILWLARKRDLACFPLPQAGPGTKASQAEALRAVQEFGEVIKAYNEGLEDDNKIKRDELRDIRREGHEAVEAILRFLATVEEEADRG